MLYFAGTTASPASAATTVGASGAQVVSDQVRELVEVQLGDKFRQMQSGEAHVFEQVFEHNTPKFVSAALPNYSFALVMCFMMYMLSYCI